MTLKVGDIVSLKLKVNEYLPLSGRSFDSINGRPRTSFYRASSNDRFIITEIDKYVGIIAKFNNTDFYVKLPEDLIKCNADIIKERLGIK